MTELAPLNITGQELYQLLLLSGDHPNENSPIQKSSAQYQPSTPSSLLEKNGWIERQTETGQPGLTPRAKAVMQSLQQPNTSVQLVLGDLQKILVTELYSNHGFRDGELVIFTERKADGRYVIRPGISPEQVSGALLEHLMIGPRLDGLEFSLSLASQTALIFFCVLDWIHTLRLKNKINNDRQISFGFAPQEIWLRAMEIQMGDDLMWTSALLPYLFPEMQFSVSEEAVSALLDEMLELGYLDSKEGRYYPNDFVVALADAITTILSFGSCAIHQIEEDGDSGFHLAFVVGVETNLVLEAVPGVDGQNWLQLTAVNGIELSKLLFRIGSPEEPKLEETQVPKNITPKTNKTLASTRENSSKPHEQIFCSKCGAPLRPNMNFCTKCGHRIPERGK